jgi:hypothetical protein
MARLEMLSFLPINTLIALAQNDDSIEDILPPYVVCDWGVFTYTDCNESDPERTTYTGYMILSTNPGWYAIRNGGEYDPDPEDFEGDGMDLPTLPHTAVALADVSPTVKRDSTGSGQININSKNLTQIIVMGDNKYQDWYYTIRRAVKMDGFESFLFDDDTQTGFEPYGKTWKKIAFTRALHEWRSEIVDDDKGERHHHDYAYFTLSASLLKNGCYIFYADDERGCFTYDPRKQGVPGEEPWSYDNDWVYQK